ncbi:MAG TPA: DUF4249 domain-containing protein [Luteibaculaceae bacterium]|nr:DUF4249 domain-containing protein [Luteibaculaceae bacterium]
MKTFYYILCSALLFASCEQEVTIDLPPGQSQIVVEGFIESGALPTVILTRSIPYYDPVNSQTLGNIFVTDASVRIRVGEDTIALTRFCLSEIPDSLREQAQAQFGLPSDFINFCVFVGTDIRLIGAPNTTYELLVETEGKTLTSTTTIPKPIALDSLWFKVDGDRDSLGFIFAQLSDPSAEKNSYRWFARRINSYTFGESAGQVKDPDFIAPFNSTFDDEYFNGLTFPFAYNRGRLPESEKEDDNNIEAGYFKRGDTVVIKLGTIDERVYFYFRDFYYSIGSTGSPFAAPSNVRSNVNGGLGVWAGYGVAFDTLVIQ